MKWGKLVFTRVMATVFAREAGGFLIVTRAMERIMARMIKAIWRMWTLNFQVSLKVRIEASIAIAIRWSDRFYVGVQLVGLREGMR